MIIEFEGPAGAGKSTAFNILKNQLDISDIAYNDIRSIKSAYNKNWGLINTIDFNGLFNVSKMIYQSRPLKKNKLVV